MSKWWNVNVNISPPDVWFMGYGIRKNDSKCGTKRFRTSRIRVAWYGDDWMELSCYISMFLVWLKWSTYLTTFRITTACTSTR